MIRFTVPQVYIKGRAKPGQGRVYTPAKTVKYDKQIKNICEDVMRRHGLKMLTEPAVLTITVRLLPPISHSKKRRAAMFAHEIGITGLYDADNVAKAVSDAINKVAFKDDRLVVRLFVAKIASSYEAVDVTVEDYREWKHRVEGQREWAGDPGRTGHPSSPPGSQAVAGIEAAQLGDQEVE